MVLLRFDSRLGAADGHEALGDALAYYRSRCRRPNGRRAWSQEELAFASGTYVFGLPGYLSPPDLPDEAAVASILAKLAPHMDMIPYPACLVDDGVRQGYLNAAVAARWGHLYGSTDPDRCLALAWGRRPIEAVFDPERWPEAHEDWRATYENVDAVLMSVIDVWFTVVHFTPVDGRTSHALARLVASDSVDAAARSDRPARAPAAVGPSWAVR